MQYSCMAVASPSISTSIDWIIWFFAIGQLVLHQEVIGLTGEPDVLRQRGDRCRHGQALLFEPMKNPPMATVSPVRMSPTASRADTILPVEPDRAVGTMDLMLIGPRSLGT
jgi:hypothetical protein